MGKMQRVLIYDPNRVPRNWVDLVRPWQFAVFLRGALTSVVLDYQGTPVDDTAAQSCFIFDNLADAKQFCLDLVAEAEHVQCEIYDERGMAIEPIFTIVNKRHQHRIGTRKTARLLMLGGVFSIAISLPLFWFDWLSSWARMWPTIFGINILLLGFRLLHIGYSYLEHLREQEAERAIVEAKSKAPQKAD
jgi:hypothetical protein